MRALLADARESDDSDGAFGGRPDAGSPASPWLPSDDLVAQWPLPVRRVEPIAPVPSPGEPDGPPENGARGAAPRWAGLIDRLSGHLPIRADPGRRGAIAVGVAVVLVAVVTGAWVLASRPHAVAVTSATADPVAVASARSAASSAGSLTPDPAPVRSATSPPLLVVDVAGKVRRPGLYRLPPGSRVQDALRAAGGARPGVDLTSLNLAAKIGDGQHIVVGLPGGAESGTGPGPPGPAAPQGPVDLNSATLQQLETLPGVGPVLGQHIIDWRVAHGQFASIDQLREVAGIGDVKFAALRSRVLV